MIKKMNDSSEHYTFKPKINKNDKLKKEYIQLYQRTNEIIEERVKIKLKIRKRELQINQKN